MLPVEYLRNGKRYPSSVFTFCNLHSFSTKCYNDDSVVVIVSEILVFKNEVVEIFGDFFNRAKTKNSVSCSSTGALLGPTGEAGPPLGGIREIESAKNVYGSQCKQSWVRYL